MGEIIQFVPKSERERIRLIRDARAIYDSVYPPAPSVSEQSDKAPAIFYANARSMDGAFS
jgi:hypothetical protein